MAKPAFEFSSQLASLAAPHETMSALVKATERLLRIAADVTPKQIAEPSALPGWTRGHVLAHISRSADSMVNMLTSARTGEHIPHYASAEARTQGIEEGAGRLPAVQLEDLRASAERFAQAAAAMPEEAWSRDVRHLLGFVFPASEIPWRRLVEVEYHLVDLDVGYTPARWPAYFVAQELERLGARFRDLQGLPPVLLKVEDTEKTYRIGEPGTPDAMVSGPGYALVAWLAGRAGGKGLKVYQDGIQAEDPLSALPVLPPLG